MLEFTLEALRREYHAAGKQDLFTLLLPFLSFSDGEERYDEIAPKAGLSSDALHVTVFDFRKRYRELLLAIVGDTVADPAEVESEMTALLCATS